MATRDQNQKDLEEMFSAMLRQMRREVLDSVLDVLREFERYAMCTPACVAAIERLREASENIRTVGTEPTAPSSKSIN